MVKQLGAQLYLNDYLQSTTYHGLPYDLGHCGVLPMSCSH